MHKHIESNLPTVPLTLDIDSPEPCGHALLRRNASPDGSRPSLAVTGQHKQRMGRLRRATAPLLFVMAAVASAAQAQQSEPKKVDDLVQQQGLIFTDDINTPLLHHVATGAPYDLLVLAGGEENSSGAKPEMDLRIKIRSRDEFKRNDAMPAWTNFVRGRIDVMKRLHHYLIPMQVDWRQYDFSKAGYQIRLSMNKRASLNGGLTYHCAGAFTLAPNREYQTACLHAVNEDQKDPFLSFFPVEDVNLARAMREKPGAFALYAVAEPAGKYRVLRGTEIRYMPLDVYAAAGIQPVRITELVLADRYSDEIYAISYKFPPASSSAISSGDKPMKAQAAEPAEPDNQAPAVNAPRWKQVTHDDLVVVYADLDSIKRDDGLVMLRVLADSAKTDSIGVRSTVYWQAEDCRKRTSRVLNTKAFANGMGSGALLVESQEPLDTKVQKGSIGERIFNFACNAVAADH